MEHLPLELFDSIFINITDTKDLLQIRAVNKLYHAIFTPKAFQKIAFESGPNGCKRFNDIASSCFAGWVQDLSFEICLQNECDLPVERYPVTVPGSGERSIGHFINLQRISVYFPGPSRCLACHFRFQDMMFKVLIESPSTVYSLTITNLRPDDDTRNHIERPEFKSFLSRLTYLSVGFAEGVAMAAETPFLEDFLKPTETKLETLVLRSLSWASELPTNLAFNNLKKLELHKFILSGPNHAITETFIMTESVASSLKEIHLSHIAICSRKPTGSNTCAGILLALREKLKVLKRFEVENGFEYMEVDGDSGYRSFIPQKEDLLVDQIALNSFWECIGQETRVKLEE